MTRMTAEQASDVLVSMAEADFLTAEEADEISGAEVVRLVEAAHQVVGRPSLTAPGELSPVLNLRVPASTKRKLEDAARRRGVRQSVIVRQALDEYLAHA